MSNNAHKVNNIQMRCNEYLNIQKQNGGKMVLSSIIHTQYDYGQCQLSEYDYYSNGNNFIPHENSWGYSYYDEIHTRTSRAGNKYYKIKPVINTRENVVCPQKGIKKSNLVNIPCNENSKYSTLCLLNARSIRNKAELIKDYVLEQNIDICAITETWLSVNDTITTGDITPDGYQFLHVDRPERVGGGVAILCKKSVKPMAKKSPTFKSFELLITELCFHENHYLLVVVYRPPKIPDVPLDLFFEEFSNFIEDIITSPDKLLILGDFNLHMDKQTSIPATTFASILDMFGLVQHVSFPTHSANHLLDLVITRESESFISDISSGFQISDHYSIMCKLKCQKPKDLQRKITYRKLAKLDIDAFCSDINNLDFGGDNDSVDDLVEKYNKNLADVLDKHAPQKTRLVTIRSKRPWFDQRLQIERRNTRKLERKWRKSKIENDFVAFKNQRDNYNLMLQEFKSKFYEKIISENSKDQKQLFKVIKQLFHESSETPLPPHESKEVLANNFGEFFHSKISKICEQFDENSNYISDDKQFTGKDTLSKFNPLSLVEVEKLIQKAPPKSCELDPVPTGILKKCVKYIAPIIKRIINTSLSSATVPSHFKQAMVTPLLKKPGLELIPKNYRPVSNLSFISKITERAISYQMNTHLEKYGLREPLQSAYRYYHSTETALVKIFDDLLHVQLF